MTKKRVKKWLGPEEDCDICHQPLKSCPYFVDGRTHSKGWALMCGKCYRHFGEGLGIGQGQRYDSETKLAVEA